MGRIGRHIFHILKNTQFACSRINLLYSGHAALNNRRTSGATTKENWEIKVPAGSNSKPQICSSCGAALTRLFLFCFVLLNFVQRKPAIGKNYSTCKVQSVIKVQLT